MEGILSFYFYILRYDPMELILDGNSEIGAHVRSNLCYLIFLRHLLRSRTVTIVSEKTTFLYAGATCFELPSNTRTMIMPKSDIMIFITLRLLFQV